MALGDSRRAGGRANSAERQAIGTNNAAERRTIQTNNTNERRGSSIQDDLNSLIRPEKQAAQLRSVEPRGSAPAQRGSATYQPPKAAVSSGGVASPLTEQTTVVEGAVTADREYWEKQILSTTDGLLVLEINPLKTLKMKDANGADVIFNYAERAPVPADE